MTIQGYQFDKCKVTPEADAALYYQLNNKQNHVIAGYKNEMNVTSSGLNVYVDTGCALVMGRYCEITNQEQLSVMANTEGYVCITIDLTETNTAEGVPGSADYVVTNNQLRVELVTELVQQDLFNDGQVYTFPLAKVVANGTGVAINKISSSYSNIYTIFSGVTFMNASSSYNFDPKLMKKGITFVTTTFNDSTSQPINANKQEFFISRTSLDKLSITGHTFYCISNDGRTAIKYIYINMQNGAVQGYANNGVGDSRNFVFREIFME